MQTRSLVVISVIALLSSVSARASAFGGTARELEREGTFAITNNADFAFSHQFGQGDPTGLTIRPALDYFVVSNLSLGGAIQFHFDSFNGRPDNTSFALAPDIGFEIALTDTWSVWPSLSVPISFPNQGSATVDLVLFVPFLVHPAEHFFFGIGPGLTQVVTANPTTTISGGFSIGGYFDH